MKVGPPAFALCLVALTTSAQACPIPGDLDAGGIRIIYDDGTREVFRRLDRNRVEMLTEDTNEPLRDVLAHGLYLLRTSDFVDAKESNTIAVDYGRAASDLPRPAPGASVAMAVRESDSSGSWTKQETYVSGAVRVLTVGTCVVDAFDVKLRREEPGQVTQLEVVRYFPEYGFGHVYGIGDAGQPLETYPLVRIEAVR